MRFRFIPACTGNSARWTVSGRRSTVHPRVYGELAVFVQRGRAWLRFIPACTGNSSSSLILSSFMAVHPRVYGELRHTTRTTRRSTRFIPACTGNSSMAARISSPSTVHPRVYGELKTVVVVVNEFSGSSPRVRGTHRNQHPTAGAIRFIPACTGNSFACGSSEARPPVHPRVYGELGARRGSLNPGLRFIPACTGNSRTITPEPMDTPVHPRVYGELESSRPGAPEESGSSPRVRGTPPWAWHRLFPLRFIPACTGNSFPR